MGECELRVRRGEVNSDTSGLENCMRFEIPHTIIGLWDMGSWHWNFTYSETSKMLVDFEKALSDDVHSEHVLNSGSLHLCPETFSVKFVITIELLE